jgi:peroxiredoxin family protein
MTPRQEHPLKSLLRARVSQMKELGLSLNFSKNMWKGKETKAKDIKWTLQLNVKFSTCHMKGKLLGYQSYQLAIANKYNTCQIILSAPWLGTFT